MIPAISTLPTPTRNIHKPKRVIVLAAITRTKVFDPPAAKLVAYRRSVLKDTSKPKTLSRQKEAQQGCFHPRQTFIIRLANRNIETAWNSSPSQSHPFCALYLHHLEPRLSSVWHCRCHHTALHYSKHQHQAHTGITEHSSTLQQSRFSNRTPQAVPKQKKVPCQSHHHTLDTEPRRGRNRIRAVLTELVAVTAMEVTVTVREGVRARCITPRCQRAHGE